MLCLAQLGTRLRLSSGPSSGLSWGLARGSGFGIQLGLSWAQLGSLCLAWCLGPGRGSVRFEGPVRLETRGSTQNSALGLDRSPARLISVPGSENIINEAKHKGRKSKSKRPEEQVSRRKTRTKNTARKSIMEPPEVIHLASFRIEQRQQAAPGGKIRAVPTCHICSTYLPSL